MDYLQLKTVSNKCTVFSCLIKSCYSNEVANSCCWPTGSSPIGADLGLKWRKLSSLISYINCFTKEEWLADSYETRVNYTNVSFEWTVWPYSFSSQANKLTKQPVSSARLFSLEEPLRLVSASMFLANFSSADTVVHQLALQVIAMSLTTYLVKAHRTFHHNFK